jgi:hypothetical protein
MYKLNQLKTPKERTIELLSRIERNEIDVDSINIERFTSSETGKSLIRVELELSDAS